jgi:hypothetical protein
MAIRSGFAALETLAKRLRKKPAPDIGAFSSAVHDVIAARTALAMAGKLSAAEARLMIAEKQSAALRAQFAYIDAVAKGNAAAAPDAYFNVYQRAVAANRRRLDRHPRWSWRGLGRRLGFGGLFLCALIFSMGRSAPSASAQEIDFDQIDKFESLGTGTLQVGSPPKVIIDDSDQHTVILTIWEADAQTKIFWTSPDGERTTVIPGKGVQTFQTAGEFKLQAIGDPAHEVQYGYVLLHLRKSKPDSNTDSKTGAKTGI